MKSVVLEARVRRKGLSPVLKEMETPTPGPGELVVEMRACGLCGTDLEKIKGDYTASMPVVGHEAVGIVSAVGAGVQVFRKGDPVFPHHHVPCHECYLCKAGSETMCDRYRSSNLVPGGFSESFKVPRWNVDKGGVLKLPRTLGFETASLTEPVGCCIRALKKLQVKPSDSVLVAGAGPVGMMHALLLKRATPRVIVSDVSATRLKFAEESGVGLALDAAKQDVPARVRSETDGRGADVAIVASGSKEAMLQGLRSVRKGGKVCFFGVPPRGSVLDYDISGLYNSDQQIVTSYGATEADTREALDVLSSRGKDFERLVTHRFRLADFDDAVEAASSARAMKVVITP